MASSIVVDLGEATFRKKHKIEYTAKFNKFTVYANNFFWDSLIQCELLQSSLVYRLEGTFVNVLDIAKNPSWNFLRLFHKLNEFIPNFYWKT